jgi:RHS repeat-associated protein
MLISFLSCAGISAQAVNNQIKDVVMPSPSAASLGKYGDIPVSYYTGVPSIGIPIHTVQQGSISLPISLSYHAGGVKVGEPASWVGLGWSLSAGGMISRTVQGKADERGNTGYFNIGHNITVTADTCVGLSTNNGNLIANADFNGKLATGQSDGEPDIFSFSIGGYNGKFYIDAKTNNGATKGKVILVPMQDVQIDYDLRTEANLFGTEKYLYKFTLTTPNGVKYEFGDVGDNNPAIEVTRPVNATAESYATGWFLKKITSPEGNNQINLSYTNEVYRYVYRISSGKQFTPMSVNGRYAQNLVDLNSFRLNTISTMLNGTIVGDEAVNFVAMDDRTDVQLTPGSLQNAKKLSSIQIVGDGYCKKFALTQSYFQDDNTTINSGQDTDFRLKLESVQESKCNGDSAVAPHIFTYNGSTTNPNYLPNRLSSATDHWGYYNGAITNSFQAINMPYTKLQYYVPYISPSGVFVQKLVTFKEGTSNRETNEESMKLGTIRQITYPTGGKTTFDYEANSYWDTEGVKKLEDEPNPIVKYFPNIYCGMEAPPTLPFTGSFTRTFTNDELTNTLFYKLEHKGGAASATAPCNNPIPKVEIYVYQGTTLICVGSIITSTDNTVRVSQGQLNELFPCLQANVAYTFVTRLTNAGYKLTFQKEITVYANANRKVGGLRIKSITSNDGISTANDVTKTYKYVSGGIGGPNMSSGQLYSKPIYGYVATFSTSTSCNGVARYDKTTHFWMENAIVPLGSFDGGHIGYSLVQEYSNATSTGYYTNYQYSTEPADLFFGLPIPPLQPRIGSGELLKKTHWSNDNLTELATETNTAKPDAYSYGVGKFIKLNSYNQGAGTGSTSFWRYYKIRNRPYRLSKVESKNDGVQSETNYTYDIFDRFYAPTEVATTNSDGKVVTTKTYYAHNLPSSHPNQTAIVSGVTGRDVLIRRFMIGIPLQTEQFVNGVQVGGSILEYTFSGTLTTANSVYATAVGFPTRAYSLNKDLSAKLNITVNAYDRGLPQSMTKAGYALAQTYSWDLYGRLTGKAFGYLSSSIAYHGNSNLVRLITDENGFKSAFYYDGLMRLETTNTFFADNSPKSTTRNTYVYGGATNPSCNRVASVTSFTDIAIPLSSNQIFDGLGRATQGTKIGYSPTGGDIKSAVTYDNLGRTDKSYQPFVATNQTCNEVIPNGTLFVQTKYEDSPLSRPIKQIAEDGKFMTTAYGSNIANEVRTFAVTGAESSVITPSGYYAADLLYKTVMTNENGKTTTVFKDKLGRVILTRKVLGTTNVDTYNVYDDYGNLVMVIPPDAISGSTISADLVFTYKYNNKNQLCEKKIPGAELQKFYYNDRDLLTFTQDGNMRAQHINRYLATEYDIYGRVKNTTWVQTANPATDALLADFSPIRTDWMNDYYYDQNPTTLAMYTRPPQVRTRPIGTLKTGDKALMWRSVQYNAKGEREWSCPEYLRANNCDDYTFNADGSLKTSNKYNNWKDNNQVDFNQVFYSQKYTYDNARRNTSVQQQLWGPNGSGGAFVAPWVELSATSYNYKDQLIEKNIGRRPDIAGAKALQSIDYQYNQRGWLTAINQMPLSSYSQVVLSGGGTMVGLGYGGTPIFNKVAGEGSVDLFSESIRYNNPDANISNIGTPQYNGNISQAVWQVAGRERQAYTYKYDDLDRLLEGEYTDISDGNGPQAVGQTPYSTDNKFGEKLTYDLRGNITSLIRNGMIAPGLSAGSVVTGTFGQIDNLAYTYNTKNQVTGITDGANASKGFKGSSSTYTYDANGNLKSDAAKGITNIIYNYLNLPQTIVFTNNRKIEFVYDGTGVKLRKTTWENGVIKETRDYMENFEYKDDKIERIHHAEGVITQRALRSGESTEFVGLGGLVWQYEYTLTDHLGNTRVTFADIDGNNTIDPNTEVNQINHYYPFGLNMEGNWNGAQGNNKYGYNGKEWNDDFGLGMNDYGARYYDPSAARWWNVDPLTEKMPRHSAYNYCFNNPIKFVDPNGCEPDAWESMKSQSAQSATIANVKNAVNAYIRGGNAFSVSCSKTYKGENGTFSVKQKAIYNSKYDDKDGKSANASMSVTYRPNKNKEGSNELAFIQIVKETQNGVLKVNNTSSASRETKEGWSIDRNADNKYAWYGHNNQGGINTDDDDKPLVKIGGSNPVKKAYFHDSALGTIWNEASGSMDFELYVVDKTSKRVYDGISWGFTFSSGDLIKFGNTAVLQGASAQYNKCITRWNEQAKGPIGSRNDPDQVQH